MFDNDPSSDAGRPTEPISTDVLVAVSAVKDVDPMDLPPLYDVIDPDALDRFFSMRRPDVKSDARTVRFTFAGCEVIVDGPDQISVSPTESPDESEIEA